MKVLLAPSVANLGAAGLIVGVETIEAVVADCGWRNDGRKTTSNSAIKSTPLSLSGPGSSVGGVAFALSCLGVGSGKEEESCREKPGERNHLAKSQSEPNVLNIWREG